jgi:signal transduction histidine kinase
VNKTSLDPAFPIMVMDILNNVLSQAENPGKMGVYLTGELRELTGARLVTLLHCEGEVSAHQHNIIGLNPERDRSQFYLDELQPLLNVVHASNKDVLWKMDPSEPVTQNTTPQGLSYDLSLAIPLFIGQKRVGEILLIGLPDSEHLKPLLEMLRTFSPVVALILRNAFLFEEQENEIERRTLELKSSNEALQKSEQELSILITQVKAYSNELEKRVQERTAELENAMREQESFSYSISHDLRAPLRVINGFATILLTDYLADLKPEAQGYLKRINQNVKRMSQLVDDLLALSKIGRSPISKKTVKPAEIIQKSMEYMQSELTGRKVTITIYELPACQADPGLLEQVFTNLLSNALKYTRKRDEAKIEIGFLSKDEQDQSGMPQVKPYSSGCYYIKDNGIGFDMRYASKLFGVFERLDRSEDYEGTGVGLAIVQRIINRHGGMIWANAAPDQGAAFYFTLP